MFPASLYGNTENTLCCFVLSLDAAVWAGWLAECVSQPLSTSSPTTGLRDICSNGCRFAFRIVFSAYFHSNELILVCIYFTGVSRSIQQRLPSHFSWRGHHYVKRSGVATENNGICTLYQAAVLRTCQIQFSLELPACLR